MKSVGKYKKVFDTNRDCYIFEHDKVWLDQNGYTQLKSIQEYKDGSYVIHHINGNRSDNRIENLQLMTRAEHAKLHATLRDSDYSDKISNSLKGIKRSAETKHKMSEAKKKNPPRSMLGKHHSEETKQKISKSNKITWSNKSDEEKIRLNEINRQKHLGKTPHNKGVPCTESQKKTLSDYWIKQYENGYVPPSKGRIFVTNGIENHQIKPEQLQEYLNNGYKKGITRRTKNDKQ